jgi:predicted GH43/DUF377 family glycosyl hydrolase
MKWKKYGLVYRVEGNSSWHRHSALQPTPILLDDATIRVFVGFRDEKGSSRVGFVDLDATDPTRVAAVSEQVALDVGEAGMFDEDGVVPCAVVRRANELFLYYAGYQTALNIKFYVFSGLAISTDNGLTFRRHQCVPITDRTDREPYFRVIHSLLPDEGVWKVWYGAGNRFSTRNGKQLPNYDIRYTESDDGITIDNNFVVAVPASGAEYRVGRPYVVRTKGSYQMFFCAGTETTGYRLAYAESQDGKSWIRDDDKLGITVSAQGWDSTMQAYPSVIRVGGRIYLFYNGNNYGREGFGLAELIEP